MYIPTTVLAQGSGGGLFDAYALVRDEKANNTNGGSSVSATWNIRDFNTVVFDTGISVSIASNRFNLPAATYYIRARAPWANSDGEPARGRLRLYNQTDAAVLAYGGSMYSNGGTNGQQVVDCLLSARVTLAAAKDLEIHHYTQLGVPTEGLGVADNLSTNEIYAEVEIWREA